MRGAFNPPHLPIEDVIAAGAEVVVRWTSFGMDSGGFMGIPAGKNSASRAIDIHRVGGRKLADHWHMVGQLALMQQLRWIPQDQSAVVSLHRAVPSTLLSTSHALRADAAGHAWRVPAPACRAY